MRTQLTLPTIFFTLVLFTIDSCSSHLNTTSKYSPPFDHAARITILSYKNRGYTEPDREDGVKPSDSPQDTLQILDLRILKSGIIDNIMLTDNQRDALTTLLNSNMCDKAGTPRCYEPRHLIVFNDKNSKPFAYVEICFECTNYQTSGKFNFNFCYEKSEALKALFQTFGVTYFGVGENG